MVSRTSEEHHGVVHVFACAKLLRLDLSLIHDAAHQRVDCMTEGGMQKDSQSSELLKRT